MHNTRIDASTIYNVLFLFAHMAMLWLFVAAVKQVRHSQIQEGGHVVVHRFVELEYPVHRLALEPGSPHTFYSCGGDGSVWHVSS
jgi:WD repeat-containing protein 42A